MDGAQLVGDATYISAELDCRTYDPFQSHSTSNLEADFAHVLRSCSRYSFTLVSRFFHKVTLPILYQTLCITDCNQLRTIRRSLDANTTRSRIRPACQLSSAYTSLPMTKGAGLNPSRRRSQARTVKFPNRIIVGGNGNRLGLVRTVLQLKRR
jgi:hypothetical protein